MPTHPKIYTKTDIPTPESMADYLSHVAAVRSVFPGLADLPPLPAGMDKLTFQEANDIERILERVGAAIETIQKNRIFSGEIFAGGF